jgi:hypothetical protein
MKRQSTTKFSVHDATSPQGKPLANNVFKEKAMVQTFKAPQPNPSPTASDSDQEIVFQNIEAQEDDNIELNESIEDELPSSRS